MQSQWSPQVSSRKYFLYFCISMVPHLIFVNICVVILVLQIDNCNELKWYEMQ
jgi:hypothetical protein